MAQQYKPGDWYELPSGNIMLYNGTSWKNVGQRGAPGGQAAITGRQSSPPGAAVNPVVAEEAAAVASNNIPSAIVPTDNINLVIKKPKTGSGTLRYPSDPAALDGASDYVVFEFYKYAPPFGGGRDTPNQAEAGSTTKLSSGGYANYQNSNDRSYANPSTDVKPIILYMPEDIQSQFGAGWNAAGFGAAAAGLLGVTGSVNTQKDFGAMVDAGGSAAGGGVKAAIFKGLLDGINAVAGANVNLNQALGSVTGTILNPNVELLYEAPKLRTFSLKFKLVPRTSKEANDIKQICNSFKKAMLPSFGGSAIFGAIKEASNLLTIPDLCQVSFMKGGNFHPYLPKYKLCGITDVNINYTAAGAYATLRDGSPVATELTISFLESKLVFAQEVTILGGGI
jgi:hypothetical protein